jgi:hypothetical protein
MADWSGQYAQDQARALAAHVARTQERLHTLADRYAALRVMLTTGRTGRAEVPTFHRRPGPSSPLRVDVLDLMQEVDQYVAALLPLVRGTLRLGSGVAEWNRPDTDRAVRVRGSLLFIASGLARVYAEDPVLGDDLARGAWQLERRAGWIFGDTSRPFALSEPCPACGVPALWVVPDKMVIRCGNPGCGAQQPLDAALPVQEAAE